MYFDLNNLNNFFDIYEGIQLAITYTIHQLLTNHFKFSL